LFYGFGETWQADALAKNQKFFASFFQKRRILPSRAAMIEAAALDDIGPLPSALQPGDTGEIDDPDQRPVQRAVLGNAA
jgi:hypothetical protein